jgi:rod shape-determining protein MreC
MSTGVSERKKIAALSFGLLCCSLLLTAYSARHPSFARVGTSALVEVIAPLHAAVDFAQDSTRSVWGGYVGLIGVSEDNEKLRARISELDGERGLLEEFKRENDRLRALLDLNSVSQLRGVAANVIGDEPSGWGQGVIVNRGSLMGARVGMAVVHPRGVVGQVVAVSPNYSHVLLITDHSSGVDVMTQDSRVRGVVEGVGADHCELRYVSKQTPLRVGDTIVTSGMDGVFPKGLIVGVVSKVAVETGTLLQNVEVKVSVDLNKLEEVLIVTGEQHQPAKVEEAQSLVKSGKQGKRRG